MDVVGWETAAERKTSFSTGRALMTETKTTIATIMAADTAASLTARNSRWSNAQNNGRMPAAAP